MNARRVLLSMFGGLIVAVVLLVAVVVEWRTPSILSPGASPTPVGTPLPARSPSVATPPLPHDADILLIARDDGKNGSWEEILTVQGTRVRSVPAPPGAVRTALPVTDGKRLYVLVEDREQPRGARKRLIAVALSAQEQTLISGSTSLVTPRAVFASPNGRVIAFFLDSVRGELTELWTVDPGSSEKRLSLERLSKNTLGPFWAPDGGFLVRDGDTILRGSPQRTGGDLLSVRRSTWKDVPLGNTMLPSPGGSQVIYVTTIRGGSSASASDLRVWDLQEGRERRVVSFPSGAVQLLGWNSAGALVATSGTDALTLWDVRKEGQQSFPLGPRTHSAVLSGDGTGIAYLREDSRGTTLVIVDARTKREISAVALPAAPPSPSPPRTSDSVYRLVQFVRTDRAAIPTTGDAKGALAPEDVVRYVTEHIRDIASAPAAEPVSAERIWLTNTPDAVIVDYRIGTTLWRRIVQVESAGGRPTAHAILGVFAPAEGEWVLTRGVNLPDPRPALLYEFEPELGKWVRKETTEDIQP